MCRRALHALEAHISKSRSAARGISAAFWHCREFRRAMVGNAKASRPTHFICFPLVTESSIPQLADSLAYFRSVTVASEESEGCPSTENTATNDNPDGKLRLIPAGAHRPPGTFHLTLGMMDLTRPKDMERALEILQDIDYPELLREAEHRRDEVRKRRGKKPHLTDGSHPEQGKGAQEDAQDQIEAEADTDQPSSDAQRQSRSQSTSEILAAPLESLSRTISPPPPKNSSTGDVSSAPTSRDIPQHYSPTSISVTLSSLGTFPKPSGSRVFYADPHDSTSRLQTFGELIQLRFKDAGLVTETRPLVLHATVANLIYAKQWNKQRRKGRKCPLSVDARDLLKYFNDGRAARDRAEAESESKSEHGTEAGTRPASEYLWAKDIVIDRVRICKMGAEKSEDEGLGLEYVPIAEKAFAS
ncbi:hypothetical protein PV11_09197 [Exophiala sideris]|uniref:A-kinase anchor protein 7-like phosphoesterase domain-containing protein n=1 Tax=Exophiala sideris TaxID=1016849 RepID=A0A0D1VN13_9EURO|nr:hypothetical protein PV11_09197 [Exophiala sideris]